MGSIHRECMNWQIVPSIQCKSVLIKASAKCINVNVGLSFFFTLSDERTNKSCFKFGVSAYV